MTRFLLDQGLPRSAAAPSVVRLRMEGLKGDDLATLMQRLWPKISVAVSGGAMVTVTRGAVRIKRLPVER